MNGTTEVMTTKFDLMSQEIVNGAGSVTVQSSVFTMTMASGTTFSSTNDMEADMLVCTPYTLAEAGDNFFCQSVELYTPSSVTPSSDSNAANVAPEGIWYNYWDGVKTIP